jgi:hypothetical protein
MSRGTRTEIILGGQTSPSTFLTTLSRGKRARFTGFVVHILVDTSFSLYRGVQPRRLLSLFGVRGANFTWRHRLPGVGAPLQALFSGPHAVATAGVMNNQCRQTVASAGVCPHLRPQEINCGAGVNFLHASGVRAGTPLDESFGTQYMHLFISPLPVLHPPIHSCCIKSVACAPAVATALARPLVNRCRGKQKAVFTTSQGAHIQFIHQTTTSQEEHAPGGTG